MAERNNELKLRLLCHIVAALPLANLIYLIILTLGGDFGALGADPLEEVMSYLGEWGFIVLLVTLAVTPVQRTWPKLRAIRYRRALGLWSFAYLALHLVAYVAGINGFDALALIEDVTERPFIIAGMLGLILMVPLAVTSTKGWQASLGARWRQLHRLVYATAILGLVHFFLQVRSDYTEFLVFAAIAAVLLGYRVNFWFKRYRGS